MKTLRNKRKHIKSSRSFSDDVMEPESEFRQLGNNVLKDFPRSPKTEKSQISKIFKSEVPEPLTF